MMQKPENPEICTKIFFVYNRPNKQDIFLKSVFLTFQQLSILFWSALGLYFHIKLFVSFIKDKGLFLLFLTVCQIHKSPISFISTYTKCTCLSQLGISLFETKQKARKRMIRRIQTKKDSTFKGSLAYFQMFQSLDWSNLHYFILFMFLGLLHTTLIFGFWGVNPKTQHLYKNLVSV